MADHNILKGSHAWEVLQGGIPAEVGPPELRTYLHAWANVLLVDINATNDLYDAQARFREDIDNAIRHALEAVRDAKLDADRAIQAAKADVEKEHARLHQRIDRRGEDINNLGRACNDAHEGLQTRLFDSEEGVMVTLAKRSDVSKLTVMLWGILVSVTTAAILLAVNLIVGR